MFVYSFEKLTVKFCSIFIVRFINFQLKAILPSIISIVFSRIILALFKAAHDVTATPLGTHGLHERRVEEGRNEECKGNCQSNGLTKLVEEGKLSHEEEDTATKSSDE